MKYFTEGSSGYVTIEFPAARWPLQGWRCAVYRHLPDGSEELMEDVANVLIRVDASETVTAGVTIVKIDGVQPVYEQAFYDVVEMRERGTASEAGSEPVQGVAHLRMRASDLVRAVVAGTRRLTRRVCSGFPGVE